MEARKERIFLDRRHGFVRLITRVRHVRMMKGTWCDYSSVSVSDDRREQIDGTKGVCLDSLAPRFNSLPTKVPNVLVGSEDMRTQNVQLR